MDQPYDGQILRERCEDASKNMLWPFYGLLPVGLTFICRKTSISRSLFTNGWTNGPTDGLTIHLIVMGYILKHRFLS